jgi:hypothetical protein
MKFGGDGGSSCDDGDDDGDGVVVHWQQVVKASGFYCGALFLVCLVTLSIFPGFLAEDVQVGRTREAAKGAMYERKYCTAFLSLRGLIDLTISCYPIECAYVLGVS